MNANLIMGSAKRTTSPVIKNSITFAYILISTLAGISLIVILVSFYLSRKITHSINNVARQITQFDFNAKGGTVITTDAKDEVAILVRRFNELMKRMNEALLFRNMLCITSRMS